MKLTEVLAGMWRRAAVAGPGVAVEVTGVAHDSRKVKPGDLFVAVPGTKADGAQFVGEAVQQRRGGGRGGEVRCRLDRSRSSRCRNARQGAGADRGELLRQARRDELTLLGVTGTNGKTTTTYLLEAICAAAARPPGVIGTIEHRFAGRTRRAARTPRRTRSSCTASSARWSTRASTRW